MFPAQFTAIHPTLIASPACRRHRQVSGHVADQAFGFEFTQGNEFVSCLGLPVGAHQKTRYFPNALFRIRNQGRVVEGQIQGPTFRRGYIPDRFNGQFDPIAPGSEK